MILAGFLVSAAFYLQLKDIAKIIWKPKYVTGLEEHSALYQETPNNKWQNKIQNYWP